MLQLTEEGTYGHEPMDWDAKELRLVHPILKKFVNRHLLVPQGEIDGTRTVEVAY
jgi:hypothetical protein